MAAAFLKNARSWIINLTARVVAHHLFLKFTLDIQKIERGASDIPSTDALAKRLVEIITLIGHLKDDPAAVEANKHFKNYILSLPSGYKPILADKIKSGAFFEIKK